MTYLSGIRGGAPPLVIKSTGFRGTLPETEALIDRMEVKPIKPIVSLIDDTYSGLKAHNAISEADCMYVRGIHDIQASKLNWIKNAHNSTFFGYPQFIPGKGIKGNALDNCIDNHYTPSTEAVNLALNDTSIIFMLGTAGPTSSRGIYGCQNGTSSPTARILFLYYTTGNDRLYISTNSYNNAIEVASGSYMGVTRYVSGPNPYLQAYTDGSATGAANYAPALSGLPTVSMIELAYSVDGSLQNHSDSTISFSWYGKGRSAAQHLGIATVMQNWFRYIGKYC